MKKLLVIVCLSVFAFGYSQEKTVIDFPKNEIKVNALMLVLGAAEASYEHLLDKESSFGVSLFFPTDKNSMDTKYSLSPYYRFFFGKKPAAGFFAEGFGMLNNYDDIIYNGGDQNYTNVNKTDFALGFGIGSKWITTKGILFEINAGIGRNLFNVTENHQLVGRGGVSLGYRF